MVLRLDRATGPGDEEFFDLLRSLRPSNRPLTSQPLAGQEQIFNPEKPSLRSAGQGPCAREERKRSQ